MDQSKTPGVPAGDAASIIAAVKALHQPLIVPIGGGIDIAFVPSGVQALSLKALEDERRLFPERIRQTATLTEPGAFHTYVGHHRRPETALFLDLPGRRLVAAVDYHRESVEDVTAPPSFASHWAIHPYPISDELAAWIKVAQLAKAEPMDQEKFASFLQDRVHEIDNPPVDWILLGDEMLAIVLESLNLHDDWVPRGADGQPIDAWREDAADTPGSATASGDDDVGYVPRSAMFKLRQRRFAHQAIMTRLATGLELTVNAQASDTVDLNTGIRNVQYLEENETRDKTGRKLRVPELFLLRLPYFTGSAPRLLPVRLYYRRRGSSIRWGFSLMRIEQQIERAMRAEATAIAEALKLPLFVGLPGIGPTAAPASTR